MTETEEVQYPFRRDYFHARNYGKHHNQTVNGILYYGYAYQGEFWYQRGDAIYTTELKTKGVGGGA